MMLAKSMLVNKCVREYVWNCMLVTLPTYKKVFINILHQHTFFHQHISPKLLQPFTSSQFSSSCFNLKALFSPHNYFNDMFAAEKFQCPNKEDYVYFRFGEKLELQHEFDTLLIGSLENGKILNSKRYGQGFLGYGDHFMGLFNDGRYVYLCKKAKNNFIDVGYNEFILSMYSLLWFQSLTMNKTTFSVLPWIIELPGFNDAIYNWETFESNTFFSLFTTDSTETKYGFDLRLTCQKPIAVKEMLE